MVMTAEPDVVEEMEEDIVNAFSFLSDDKGLLTWKGLEEFDEIEELMADGLLAKEELMTMWEEAPKATSSGATPAVDIDGFSVIMRKIDALFEDLDDGDDKDDEENEPDGAASVKAVADAPIVGESGRLRAAFTDIVGAGGAASLADVLRWEDIRSLIDEGQLAVSEVENAFAAAADGNALDFRRFIAFNAAVEDLFISEDEEEAAAAIPTSETATVMPAVLAPIAVVAEAAVEAPAAAAIAVASVTAEDGELQAEFVALTGSLEGVLSYDGLLWWGEIQELLQDNQLDEAELRQLWAAAPKASAGDLLNFAGFAAFNTQLDALFEMDDGEGDDTAAAAAAPAAAVAAPVKAGAPAAVVVAAGSAPAAGAEFGAAARERLLKLIAKKTSTCGFLSAEGDREDILEAVEAVVAADGDNMVVRGAEAVLAALPGTWELIYSSSKSLEFNQGLTGLASSLPGAEFGGVRQRFDVDGAILEFEYEELLTVGGSQPLTVSVKGDWEVKQTTSLITGAKTLAVSISPQTMKYGFINLRADRWKPLRAMNLLDVVYVDERIRVMRGQTATTALFVFARC